MLAPHRKTLFLGSSIIVFALMSACGDSASDSLDAANSTNVGDSSADASAATNPGEDASEPSTESDGSTPSGDSSPPAGAGRFYVVGGDIVDPDGNKFFPVGANMAARVGTYETGYAFNWNGTGTGHAQDVLNWGWNTVRINNICNAPGNPSNAETIAGIDAFIDEYTAKKIVVVVACMDSTGKNWSTSDSALAGVYAVADHVATKYKDNTYVWFDIFNEPFSGNDAAATANWLALENDALSRIRAIAPTSIFSAVIPGFGQSVPSLMGSNSVLGLGAGKCNVVYSWHAYGALGDYADMGDETKSRVNHKAALDYLKANHVPVYIGEFGDPMTLGEGTAGQPIWNRIGAHAVMDYAPGDGIGLLWWNATGDSSVFLTYSLMADRHAAPWSAALTGAGLANGPSPNSNAGTQFWQISHNKPNLGRFTGNLADSHCP